MNRRSLLKMLGAVPLIGWLVRPTTIRVPEWDADVEVKPLGPAEFDKILAQMEEHRRATERRMLKVELKLDTSQFDRELQRAIRRILREGRV